MMRYLLKIMGCLIGFSCLTGGTNLAAQNWVSLGNGLDFLTREFYTDTVTNRLYAIGYFTYADDTVLVNGVTYWDGIKWNDLDSGNTSCPFNCNPIKSIYSYQNNIYVGGDFFTFKNIPNTKFITRFNGVNWESIGNANNPILKFYEYNNKLLVLGHFDTIGGIYAKNLALFDGINWSEFDTASFISSGDFVGPSALYKGELYVGGNFDLPNGVEEIAKFNGSQWVSVGGGIKGDAWVDKMLVYKNELYVAGQFHKSDGNSGNGIMKWNGSTWSDLNNGLTFGIGAQIKDMVIYNDELIVVGFMLTADGFPVQNIAKWDGTKWCNFRNNFNGTAEAIAVYNNELIVSCRDSMDLEPVKYIAKWIGGNQSDTCGVVGINELKENNFFTIYPNPNNGSFTIAIDKFENTTIEIYNIEGQLITKQSLTQNKSLVDLTTFSKGMYFVKVNTTNGMTVEKIVYQ
ncbi:MAG: T9SS type A sorting domain-containing protein [Flavobacteriales bacterium]|nr:T9SS type A sorting domain-containing protein [Flavobacteriales bacterium]